jgi:mannose-6-phosphate isomerase-like protein (cupin superfamily)
LFAVAFSLNVTGQEANKKVAPKVLLFHADSLISELRSQDKRWISFLKGDNVLTGLYHLKSGEEDLQKPHDTDEVYYVIEGKAKFTADKKTSVVTKGSILFVKADVPHKFKDIEEDLLVLVFFDQ